MPLAALIYIIAFPQSAVQHPHGNRNHNAMSEMPSAIPLGLGGIDQAYPIVQTLHPALTMDEWRGYARALIAAGDPVRGVMTAQYGGYSRGLFCHWPDRSLDHSSMLIVDNVAVMDLCNPQGAMRALVAAMEALAARHGCGAIHTLLTDHRPTTLHGHLQELGHRVDRVVLCKVLAA